MANIEHTIDGDTGTQTVCIFWDSGECVRYTIDSDRMVWMTGYGMEGSHVIETEYEIGEYDYADGGDFETVADAVRFVIDSVCAA